MQNNKKQFIISKVIRMDDIMKQYTKKQLLRLRIALIFESKRRTKYIVKHHVFKQVGKHFFFQPRIIPSDPELILFHDNVTVASDVTFINHDIVDHVLNHLNLGHFDYNSGCIEVMDNVFIGAGSIILPNVRIGSNVIVSSGSVVTKDVEPNSVIAGVPAKKIGTFDDYIEKRKTVKYLDENHLWKKFFEEKDKNTK